MFLESNSLDFYIIHGQFWIIYLDVFSREKHFYSFVGIKFDKPFICPVFDFIKIIVHQVSSLNGVFDDKVKGGVISKYLYAWEISCAISIND